MALSIGQREVRLDEAFIRRTFPASFKGGDKIVGARVTLPTMGDEVIFLVENKVEEAKD